MNLDNRTARRRRHRPRRRDAADVSDARRLLGGGHRRSSPAGKREILIDLTPVTYVDSATIGCLMDLYRQVHGAGGQLKLSGVQKRVETMLTMTGAQNFIEIHADEPSAVKSFGALAMRTIKTTTGADDRARRRPAGRHGSALSRSDRQARARAHRSRTW